jgi:hypothetical protein
VCEDRVEAMPVLCRIRRGPGFFLPARRTADHVPSLPQSSESADRWACAAEHLAHFRLIGLDSIHERNPVVQFETMDF